MNKQYKNCLLVLSMAAVLWPVFMLAMSSESYSIPADSINIGGVPELSDSYRTEDTIGEGATGFSQSDTYHLFAGYQTPGDYLPAITFAVHDNTADLGTLSTIAVSTDTTTFSVFTNAADGYAVSASGNTLTSNSGLADIDAIDTPAASAPGNEQFGINLANNAVPNVGADPAGGSGVAAVVYDTADNFMFVSGDTIASCDTYSENTAFTISYVANIDNSTVAGDYYTNITLIATAQF